MDEIVEVPLGSLSPHPGNCNRMADGLFEKLVAHIGRTGRYPPVVVRAHPGQAAAPHDPALPRYQVLDGHHRVAALRRLGRSHARCVVWDVGDDEALLLLATLNRLQGRDEPRRRAVLLRTLAERTSPGATASLVAQLPESKERLRRYLALARPVGPPAAPPDPGAMPVAVHFFLLPDQRRRVEARLRAIGGTREEALMRLVDEAQASAAEPRR